MSQAAGGLAGCVVSGFLADRLTCSQTYLFLFISCLGHALPSLAFPFHQSVLAMCLNSFVFGLFDGTFHTSANVLLLDIWRGRKSSPYMYTMHLFFGLGSFLTPLITEKFQHAENAESHWNINNLYPIIGI